MSNHNHHGMPQGFRHVCMMEGPDPSASLSSRRYDALEEQNKNNLDEIQRLRALLATNNIPWEPSSKSFAAQPPRRSTRRSSMQPSNAKALPRLPTEIQLRILSHALTSPKPIIDPFYKLRRESITKEEWSRHGQINIHFLVTCKSFQVEGMRFLVANNTFIFTQAAALENFATMPKDLRITVKDVTLRVVGRYYDNISGKRDLTGNVDYHPQLNGQLMMPIVARPPGMIKDRGIQAYCWEQLADFLKALQMPAPPSVFRQKLLPSLETMRIDLVNFCDHLPYGGYQFSSLVRWHLGPMVDELLITGSPDDSGDDGYSNEERVLHQLVRDEGLIGSAPPIFVSNNVGIRPLKPLGVAQTVIRADKEPSFKSGKALIHPEGGEPPKSMYPVGRTIWKWTSDSLSKPAKRWIEFDRRSGYPADDIDGWSDMWSDMDY